eukprot:s113_g26.t2
MQMQQMQMQQIQQQVMYAVQQHVQQQIQQTAESGTGQDAFKNPEAISAFAAAATTAALFYCQSLQTMAPMEVPMAPYAWGPPPGWQMPWYPTGPCANEAAPAAPKEEVPCTPKKEPGEHNSDGVTPSPVQHLNFGATPSDYGTAGPYATLSPMILKLSEVVNTDCQSPTTASDRPSTGCEQSETPEENAGAMLLQLLKGGAKEESTRPAEGHITPSTASDEEKDSHRQALASSGQELLRQLRGGAEAKAQKGTSGKATHVRRAKNGEVRVLQI